MAGKNGKTRPFTAVNYSAAKLAREKQRREYEQQKKEKLIFAMFVVIILVMILFAILIFRRVLGDDQPDPSLASESTDTSTETEQTQETEGQASQASTYENKVFAKDQIYVGDLLLIDASHAYRNTNTLDLKDIYSSRNKFEKASSSTGYVYSYYSSGKTEMLAAVTIEALNSMADEFYRAKGNNDLYIHANEAYVADSGDEHATGYAFDLSVYTIDHQHYELDDSRASSDFKWVEENYYKYGFIRRYPEAKAAKTGVSDDPYHFRYVGVAHAYYMYKNNLCLEEYLDLLRTKHTFSNEGQTSLVFTADNGTRYEVYYVAAEGDMIQVPVRVQNASYTVSGDNMSGFVVTIQYE